MEKARRESAGAGKVSIKKCVSIRIIIALDIGGSRLLTGASELGGISFPELETVHPAGKPG
jgi:hypothetical protein